MKKIFIAVSFCVALFAQADDKCHFYDDKTGQKYYGRRGTATIVESNTGTVNGGVAKFDTNNSRSRQQPVCRDDQNPNNSSTKFGDGWSKDEEYENRLKEEKKAKRGY